MNKLTKFVLLLMGSLLVIALGIRIWTESIPNVQPAVVCYLSLTLTAANASSVHLTALSGRIDLTMLYSC